MKILLLNQFFWPDSAATSQLLTDLARCLEQRGHEVFAICAETSYALRDTHDRPRVEIQRVKGVHFVRGPVGRLLSYASFFVSAAIKGLRLPKPDLVITLTTPPLLSILGTVLKLFRGSRHFIWEMDVYPDIAIDLGYIRRGGIIDHLIGAVADFSRHRSDGILALGECMRARLTARGIAADKIHVAENWADAKLIRYEPLRSDPHPLRLLYSGNLGLAHDVDTVKSAIAHFKDEAYLKFIFAGGGPRRQDLETWCQSKKLRHVEFRSYSMRTDLGQVLGSADIGLVTQQSASVGSVVPSKVYGLLAAGRPVLFIGPAASTAAKIIRRFACGWHIECGDAAALIRLLAELASDHSAVIAASRNARHAFLKHYERQIGVDRICDLIGATRHETASELLARAAG